MPHTLLVADESLAIQRLVALTFAGGDVQVIAAGSGRQAIDHLQADRPDIVLADAGMPDGDGYELAAFIARDSRLSGIPVVLLTGEHAPIDEAKARTIGCDGVLVKPFESQALVDCVMEILSRPGHTAGPVVPGHTAGPVVPRHTAGSVVPGHTAGPVGRASGPSPQAVNAGASGGDPLEAYFDRLDAAFASLAAAPPRSLPADAGDDSTPVAEPGGLAADFAPETVVGGNSGHVLPAGFGLARRPHSPNELALFATERAGGGTPQARTERTGDVLPPAGTEWTRGGTPRVGSERTGDGTLRAAEAQRAGGDMPSTVPDAARLVVSEAMVEQIAHRVIARLGDDAMRRLILDTAERLVREEIARIKASSSTGHAQSGG